jgi:vesicle-fusing ATPase
VYFKEKLINYGERYTKIWNLLENAAEMKDNLPNQKRAVLLYGEGGNGKTSIALNYAKHSKFSYVKFITPDNFVGLTDMQKVLQLSKIF